MRRAIQIHWPDGVVGFDADDIRGYAFKDGVLLVYVRERKDTDAYRIVATENEFPIAYFGSDIVPWTENTKVKITRLICLMISDEIDLLAIMSQ